MTDLSEENRSIKNARKMLEEMLFNEQINVQTISAKLNEAKQIDKINFDILEEKLEKSKMTETDLKHRLQCAEMCSAKMLKRVRQAEAKLLENSESSIVNHD